MARLHNAGPKVLAAYRSYHGSTTNSIHLTGDPRRWASDTGAAGAVHFFGPFLYRSAFGSTTPEEEGERALAHLEQVILLEGPSTISALVLEPVTGSSGVMCRRPAICAASGICTRHGIVFIADEVLVGFGRTGAWFGVDYDGVTPTSWFSRKASTPGTCHSAACWSAIRSTRHSPNVLPRRE